jgi:2-oxoglutarate ferredoxin oxidoreductase subunit delta
MDLWRRPLDADKVTVPLGQVFILADRCKGCCFCTEFCPTDILVMSEEFNVKGYHYPEVVEGAECVNCHLCELLCPEFSIYSLDLAELAQASELPVAEARA